MSATVKDATGNLVAGAPVAWSTSAGTLASGSSTTNASGVATVVLTSSTTAGTATVTANLGTVSNTATVVFTTASEERYDGMSMVLCGTREGYTFCDFTWGSFEPVGTINNPDEFDMFWLRSPAPSVTNGAYKYTLGAFVKTNEDFNADYIYKIIRSPK